MKLRYAVLALALAVTLPLHAFAASPALPIKEVSLSSSNTISLRGEVNDAMADDFIRKLAEVEGKTVEVVINSPGGSVVSGGRIIDAMQASGKTFNCTVAFGASMAFVITQHCTNRYILGAGVLMQHQPSFGLRNGPARNQANFVKFLDDMTDEYDEVQAARMGLTLKQFQELVNNDLWLTARQALKLKAADAIASASCSSKLVQDETIIEVQSFFGSVYVVLSSCPLITEPLRIQVKNEMLLRQQLGDVKFEEGLSQIRKELSNVQKESTSR